MELKEKACIMDAVPTSKEEIISVKLAEIDGEDKVVIEEQA